ncbi:MAG: aspartate-semialdehyde dehydrogenase [Chloroflexota bacterium]
MAGLRIALAGATGLVGRTILQVLQERRLPVGELILMASARSAGTTIPFAGNAIGVRKLSEAGFAGCDLAFFSAGAAISRQFAPIAAAQVPLVIDNSSAWRSDPEIPLIVPEVNGDLLRGYRGIVANPNCSTVQMVVALQPLHEAFVLESVIVSTYQSVSGSGAKGVHSLDWEMSTETHAPDSPNAHQIAFNVLPHIDALDASGWSGEELKMINETRKIMRLPDLHVVPTTVRVPVRIGHSESVYARFRDSLDPVRARASLSHAAGISIQDEPESAIYPLAINSAGRDEVFVGRIRQIPGDDHAIAFWVVADNLRKGAATNAVQIAQASMTAGVHS